MIKVVNKPLNMKLTQIFILSHIPNIKVTCYQLKAVISRCMLCVWCHVIRLLKNSFAAFKILESRALNILRVPFKLASTVMGMTMEGSNTKSCATCPDSFPDLRAMLYCCREAASNVVSKHNFGFENVLQFANKGEQIFCTAE